MLHDLGCILYSPSLEYHIRQLLPISNGDTWEVQLRGEMGLQSWDPFKCFECVVQSVESSTNDPFALTGCSIWCVELLRREIQRQHPGSKINAILIDFFLYDTVKDQEAKDDSALIPHHRTRSIWY